MLDPALLPPLRAASTAATPQFGGWVGVLLVIVIVAELAAAAAGELVLVPEPVPADTPERSVALGVVAWALLAALAIGLRHPADRAVPLFAARPDETKTTTALATDQDKANKTDALAADPDTLPDDPDALIDPAELIQLEGWDFGITNEAAIAFARELCDPAPGALFMPAVEEDVLDREADNIEDEDEAEDDGVAQEGATDVFGADHGAFSDDEVITALRCQVEELTSEVHYLDAVNAMQKSELLFVREEPALLRAKLETAKRMLGQFVVLDPTMPFPPPPSLAGSPIRCATTVAEEEVATSVDRPECTPEPLTTTNAVNGQVMGDDQTPGIRAQASRLHPSAPPTHAAPAADPALASARARGRAAAAAAAAHVARVRGATRTGI